MSVPTGVRPPSALAVWGALLIVYLVWGSTYLGIRIVVGEIPPLLAMGLRFCVAAVLMGAIVLARSGRRALAVSVRGFAATALVGALLLLGGNGGVAVAEQTVPSGLAALLVSATPLWLVALRALTGDRPRRITVVGTVLGFLGIAVLARPGSIDGAVHTWGILTVVGATLSWAIGSFLSPRLAMPRDPFVATVYEMLAGGLLLLLAATAHGDWASFEPGQVSRKAWLWLGYLIVVGSIAAFSAFVWLLGNAPISLTATYAYVNPVVAVALGALVLSEPITGAVLLGGLVVVLGVGLVVSGERRRQVTSAAAQPQPERAQVT